MRTTTLILLIFSLFFQSTIYSINNELNNPDDLVIETITFVSGDGLINVTADTYIDDLNTEFILLCHQAGYSRGEYIETAPILAGLGFNCMAIDQRSGNQVNGVVNQTAIEANGLGLPQNFFNAIPDIESAIDKAYELNGNNPIYLFGSSYSAALSLVLGRDNPKVKAVIAFSPGEYIPEFDISQEVTSYAKPVFVTSSQSEITSVTNLVSGINPIYLTHFMPTVAGIHGSRSLWSSTTGYEQYWDALEQFLFSVLATTQNIFTDFSIYPNPSTGLIYIKAEGLNKIEILDMLGKKVQEISNTNVNSVLIEGKGIYYVKIYTDRGNRFSKVAVK